MWLITTKVLLITIAIVAGLLVSWLFLWIMAYPNIGYRCELENTVKTTELKGKAWHNEDEYLTTFLDGTQTTTRYVKLGENICLRESARFPF